MHDLVRDAIDLNDELDNFSRWVNTCKNLPALEARNPRLRPVSYTKFISYVRTVKNIQMRQLKGNLLNPEDGTPVATNNLIYVQKESPQKPIYYYSWGDLHGDIQSLVRSLSYVEAAHHTATGGEKRFINNDWKIVDPDIKLVFCGDFTDRGTYGIEVMQTILKLKLVNPDQVILVRGNHEDIGVGESEYNNPNNPVESSFHGQLRSLYRYPKIETEIASLYGSLPCALFVNTRDHILQYCHGGIEPAYNPAKLLATSEPQKYEQLTDKNLQKRSLQYEAYCNDAGGKLHEQEQNMFKAIRDASADEGTHEPIVHDHVAEPNKKTSIGPKSCGLCWNQFTPERPSRYSSRGNSLVCGTDLTNWYVNRCINNGKTMLVRRAHQHGRTMEKAQQQGDGSMKNITIDDPVSGGLKNEGFHTIKSNRFTILTNVLTPIHKYAKGASFMCHIVSPDKIEHEAYYEVPQST